LTIGDKYEFPGGKTLPPHAIMSCLISTSTVRRVAVPTIDIDGIDIAYDIIGNGRRTAAITPGGRFSKDTPGVRALAEKLAEGGLRVLIWDRPNCGQSAISFAGETESRMNADVQAGLLQALGLGRVLLVGGSAGSRVSLLTAIRHPDVVERLFLLWISGGGVGLASLGGMEAVAALPSWKEQLTRNPGNRQRMLRQDVTAFIDSMKRWAWSFFPKEDCPVPDMLPSDLRALRMPVMILRSGVSDFHHPRETTEAVHALIPGSQMAEPPWGDREWLERLAASAGGEGPFVRWPLLAPQILEFSRRSPT
jgi:pimeloyl-ACP methyl ester carboxylesterase